MDIFGGHHKIGLYLGVISVHISGLFLRSWYRMGIFLGVAKISNIFWGKVGYTGLDKQKFSA